MRALGWDVLVYGGLYVLLVFGRKRRKAVREQERLRWN